MDGVVGSFTWGACLECGHCREKDGLCHFQDIHAPEILLNIDSCDENIICKYFERR